MQTKVKKYKMGTDPVMDGIVGALEGYSLYLVTGKWGMKPILVEKGQKRERFRAAELYAEKYGKIVVGN